MSLSKPGPHVHLLSTQGAGTQTALFGYRIPYLPDNLADHTLLGQTDGERVAEILSRWTQFIAGLHKWRGSAFALRFHAFPEAGSIDVALIGRVLADQRHTGALATQVADDLGAQLTAFGMPQQALDEQELREVLLPFRAPSIVEVRQHQELTPFLTINQDA